MAIKYVVIKPTVTKVGNHSEYSYPNLKKVNNEALCYNYESAHPSHEQLHKVEGEDKDLDELLLDNRVTEYSKTDAETLGKSWKPTRLICNDDKALMDVIEELIEKQSYSNLSKKSKDALNPDNSEHGVTRTKEFKI